MIAKQKWEWFGNAGHFICGNRCQFHLTTRVGKYVVSTVGELVLKPDSDRKFEPVGANRLYETMVFDAGKPCRDKECGKCGLPRPAKWMELDFQGYNTAGDATRGHMKMCRKWASAK